jgi:hypothetical protein
MKSAVFFTILLGVRCDSLAHLGQRWPRQWLRGLIGNSPCSRQITGTLMMYWVWRDNTTADAETVSVRVNHLREMLVKLVRLESESHMSADDLADVTMQQLLDLRLELLAAAGTTRHTHCEIHSRHRHTTKRGIPDLLLPRPSFHRSPWHSPRSE